MVIFVSPYTKIIISANIIDFDDLLNRDLNSVRWLEITDCNNLDNYLTQFPNLESIIIKNHDNLKLPILPSLKNLELYNVNINSIKEQPLLETLVCGSCNATDGFDYGLEIISNLPNLKKLEIIECRDLHTIEKLPILTHLKLVNCANIEEVNIDFDKLLDSYINECGRLAKSAIKIT
jgi:hypothetical protein